MYTRKLYANALLMLRIPTGPNLLTNNGWCFADGELHKIVNLMDLVKNFATHVVVKNGFGNAENKPLKIRSTYKLHDFISTDPSTPSLLLAPAG